MTYSRFCANMLRWFSYNLSSKCRRLLVSVFYAKDDGDHHLPSVTHSISQLMRTIDYDASSSTIDAIPEREWRLLAVLARKREELDERDSLANELRKMWLREKQEREMIEAETLDQYKKYLSYKREQERSYFEQRRLQRCAEQQAKRGQLISTIRWKERRAADKLAWIDDRKTNKMVDQALEEQARTFLAADRRTRLEMAQKFKKLEELEYGLQKVNDARRRRWSTLKNTSQRATISNALNSWESMLIRQEVSAMESARRVAHAARATEASARGEGIVRARAERASRARKVAALTQVLRDFVRSGR